MNKTTGTILLILLVSLIVFNLEPFKIPEVQAYPYIYGNEAKVRSQEVHDLGEGRLQGDAQSGESESFRSISGDYTLSKASFYLFKIGSPIANLTAKLYNANNHAPVGYPLTTSIPINTTSIGSLAWYNFTFPTSYMVANDTWYCITLEASLDGFLDSSNYIRVAEQYPCDYEGKDYTLSYGVWNENSYPEDVAFIVYGYPKYPYGSELVCPTISGSTAVRYQKKEFYAAGRYWQFFANGSEFSGIGYFTSSIDGVSWEDPTSFGSTRYHYGESVDSWFDGTNVTVVRKLSSTLLYRRGTPESDGTISWAADWQMIWNGLGGEGGGIGDHFSAVDTEGYPWVGWYVDPNAHPDTYNITKSDWNNGTWHTAAGYPITLAQGYYTEGNIVPLSNQALYVILTRANSVVKGIYYNGSSWSSLTTISTSAVKKDNWEETWSWSVAKSDNDDVHLVFLTTSPHKIVYQKRTNSTGSWSSETIIQSNLVASSSPILSIERSHDMLVCFWKDSPTLDHIYFKRMYGTWDESPTDWLNEEIDHLAPETTTGNGTLNSFEYAMNGYIGLSYITGTAAPYKLKFALLKVTPFPSITFHMNENGSFFVNGEDKPNGTTTTYPICSILHLLGVLEHYHVHNFTWNNGVSFVNPYDLQISMNNLTVWCYFKGDPYVTFFKSDGTFSVNGSSKANATEIQYALGTVLNLQGSGWTKYYGFANFTLSYGESSGSNPYSYVVSHASNFSIWLYHKWSPTEYPPEMPPTPSILQYLIQGNYLGFVAACFTSVIGETFYALFMVFTFLAVYLRLKSIVLPLALWILLGGIWVGLAPSVTPFVYLFWCLGIGGGVLFALFSKGSEN